MEKNVQEIKEYSKEGMSKEAKRGRRDARRKKGTNERRVRRRSEQKEEIQMDQ